MSGWIEQQLQKLRTKEQEYRAWVRDSLQEDSPDTSDFGKIEVLESDADDSQDTSESLERDGVPDESTGESTSEETHPHDGSPSPAPRAAHRRILIQRAEDLLRRMANLDGVPTRKQRRRAERLSDRLGAYLQEAPEPNQTEKKEHLSEKDPVEKDGRDPIEPESYDQSSDADQESKVGEDNGPEVSNSKSETEPRIKEALCEAFIEWCHEGGAMVDRYYMFERRVRNEHDDVEVAPIYRDTRASGVQLTYDPDDISDEFWLVETDTHHLVYPQPRDTTHFRTLDPLFESVGDPSPETLSNIRPAVVRLDGDSYSLVDSGLVK